MNPNEMKRYKKIVLAVYLCCFGTEVTAQNRIPLEAQWDIEQLFKDKINPILSHLDKSKVPFGLLKDIAFESIDMDDYQGMALQEPHYVAPTHFYQIVETLHNTNVDKQRIFPSLAAKMQRWKDLQESARHEIIVSGLLYQYAAIRADALSSGLMSIENNQAHDQYVNGKWQNPYRIQKVFAIAPLYSEFGSLLQTLRLPQELWESNMEISSIAINLKELEGLSEDRYIEIPKDKGVVLKIKNEGLHTLLFRVRLKDGALLYSYSKINIGNQKAILKVGDSTIMKGAKLNKPDAIVTFPAHGAHHGGKISIRYANVALKLRRPVLILEGFDPDKLINPARVDGATDYDSFLKSLKTTEDYSLTLNNLLLNKYDLIYVDWYDGVDDIRNNAKLVEEIICYVNQHKSPLEDGSIAQNIIIGQSMGGLVGRYALRKMELADSNHQTRLMISYDSPHKGANIPIAFQYLSNHLASLFSSKQIAPLARIIENNKGFKGTAILNLARTPAARQMLINYIDAKGQIDNRIHDDWQKELQDLGHPQGFKGQFFRNVAVSNGSEFGGLSGSIPGSNLLSVHGRLNLRALNNLINIITTPSNLLSAITNQGAFLLDLIPGSSNLNLRVIVNTIAEGGDNMIYKGVITYTKKLLWLFPIVVDLTREVRKAPEGIFPYDSYAGGIYRLSNIFDLPPKKSSKVSSYIKAEFVYSIADHFSFIPVASALDIGVGRQLNNDDFKRAYLVSQAPQGSAASPFVNFITDLQNTDHISINQRLGDWIAGEIELINNGK